MASQDSSAAPDKDTDAIESSIPVSTTEGGDGDDSVQFIGTQQSEMTSSIKKKKPKKKRTPRPPKVPEYGPKKHVPSSIPFESMPKEALLSAFKCVDKHSADYRCKLCGAKRTLRDGTGLSNYRSHFDSCPRVPEIGEDEFYRRLRTFYYDEKDISKRPVIRKTIQDHFDLNPHAICLRLLIFDGAPFSLFESTNFRKLAKVSPPSRNTLKKDLLKLHQSCNLALKAELKGCGPYALQLDGWSRGSVHYVCVMISFCDVNDDYKERMLCFRPLPARTNQSAANHAKLIKQLLKEFELPRNELRCFVGDHASTNPALAKKHFKVPLLGCQSHRLNLAVKSYLDKEKQVTELLEKIDAYMSWAVTNKEYGYIEKSALKRDLKTGFKGKRLNPIRWTSNFDVMARYKKLLEAKVIEDTLKIRREIILASSRKDREAWVAKGELSRDENDQVIEICKSFQKNLLPGTKHLQKPGLNYADAVNAIELVFADFPYIESFFKRFKSPCRKFEQAVKEILDGNSKTLPPDLVQVADLFLKKNKLKDDDAGKKTKTSELPFDEKMRLKRLRKKHGQDKYVSCNFIPSTSVSVERAFSRGKFLLRDLRTSMSDNIFEALMVCYWNHEFFIGAREDWNDKKMLTMIEGDFAGENFEDPDSGETIYDEKGKKVMNTNEIISWYLEHDLEDDDTQGVSDLIDQLNEHAEELSDEELQDLIKEIELEKEKQKLREAALAAAANAPDSSDHLSDDEEPLADIGEKKSKSSKKKRQPPPESEEEQFQSDDDLITKAREKNKRRREAQNTETQNPEDLLDFDEDAE